MIKTSNCLKIALSILILASLSLSQPVQAFDLSGSYASEITGSKRKNVYRKSPRPGVKIEHDGRLIKGSFGDNGGSFEGTIDGDIIKYRWRNGLGTDGGFGTWTVLPGGTRLEGSWQSGHYGNGKWNLTRVEPLIEVKSAESPPDSPSLISGQAEAALDDTRIFPVSSGSGFAVSAGGHVVTNSHVINGCNEVSLHFQGEDIQTRLIYGDPVNDLAILQADFVPQQVFRISRRNPAIMQEVFVAGFPFGDQISSSIKVTKGIVSSLAGVANNISNIQIDAALQPGNSGGPIFDEQGNVIGVAVAKLDLQKAVKNWGVIPENTNFGIKSTVVVNMLESNGIQIRESSQDPISRAELGAMMNGATYHLTCWMTKAQLQKMKSSKVVYDDLNKQ